MRLSRSVLSILIAVAAAACATPPESRVARDTQADEAEIRRQTDAFLQAYNAGDAVGATAHDDEGIIKMRPDGPDLVGKAAVSADLAQRFATTRMSQSATVDEVAVWDDVAMSRGTWEVTESPIDGAGTPVTSRGDWMVVQKRQPDGSWKAWRHIWNRDRGEPLAAR